LVNAFDLAGKTTHPQSVGSGREKSAKDKLKRVLPAGVGVGSGFVIDSFGNTSKQCDIILYEEQFALRFAPNDDELYTYYNCENVVAVGQVKSDASIADVRDSIENLKSVRKLKRLQEYSKELMGQKVVSCYRKYLSTISTLGTAEEEFNQETKSTDQIFTFLICKSFKTSADSIFAEIRKICCNDRSMYPNRLLSTEGDYCFWLLVTRDKNILKFGAMESTHFTKQKAQCAFGHLVSDLTNYIKFGRSVPLNNAAYLTDQNGFQIIEPVYPI